MFRLLHEEGFFVGASSGLNVVAAVQAAKLMGPGHTIVTCLCDTGQVRCSKTNETRASRKYPPFQNCTDTTLSHKVLSRVPGNGQNKTRNFSIHRYYMDMQIIENSNIATITFDSAETVVMVPGHTIV